MDDSDTRQGQTCGWRESSEESDGTEYSTEVSETWRRGEKRIIKSGCRPGVA